jgi:hypothetical protein
VLAGGGVRDTIGAVLDAALRIRVHQADGTAAAHVIVRFTPLMRPIEPGGPAYLTTYVGGLASPNFEWFVADSTKGDGTASVRVGLALLADTGGVIVAVPDLGLVDTVPYYILPGKPVGLSMSPTDTAITVGRSHRLNGVVRDRAGNPVAAPITYRATTTSLTVSASGEVKAAAPTRSAVIASSSVVEATDTIGISVVPAGTIAVAQASLRGGGLTVLELDGSGVRIVPMPMTPGTEVGPVWAPNGQSLVAVANGLLFHVPLEGTPLRLTPEPLRYGPVSHVDVAPDGQWIYFATNNCNLNSILYKMPLSGGTESRLSQPLADEVTECFELKQAYPSVSPDGTRLVFENDSVAPSVLQLFTLASGTSSQLGVAGSRPRWSPSGTQIAYNANEQVWVMNADASGARRVSPVGVPFAPGVAWSPDGTWLLVREKLPSFSYTRVGLLHVGTGQLIPLPYTTGYNAYSLPSWRP